MCFFLLTSISGVWVFFLVETLSFLQQIGIPFGRYFICLEFFTSRDVGRTSLTQVVELREGLLMPIHDGESVSGKTMHSFAAPLQLSLISLVCLVLCFCNLSRDAGLGIWGLFTGTGVLCFSELRQVGLAFFAGPNDRWKHTGETPGREGG